MNQLPSPVESVNKIMSDTYSSKAISANVS
jgi:hypothetical protein